MIPPETFDLQSNTLSCNKVENGKYDCKLDDISTGNVTGLGLLNNILFTGGIPNMITIVGGDKADLFVQGDAKCNVINDVVHCTPME
jgi:hypothetical protein